MMDFISNEAVAWLTDLLQRLFVRLGQDMVTDVDPVQTRAKMFWRMF